MEWFQTEDFWRDFYPYMFPPERFAAAKDDVNAIMDLVQCSGGPLLDLCCGPGRHAVEFAQHHFEVTGVDASPFLLERAREHAAQNGATIEWIQEDMRNFVRPGAFVLACNLFTSFGYFKDEQDDLQVLKNLYQSLNPAGVLVMEMLGKERLARTWQNAICSELADGSLLLQRPKLHNDWCRLTSHWTLIRDSHARSFSFEHTIYSGRELKDRLLSCGFQKVELYGSLHGAPYNLDALRLVAVARKHAS